MICKGKIEKLDNIVVSDPYYDKNVYCRYEREKLNEKDWLVTIELNEKEEEIDGFKYNYIDLCILLSKNESSFKVDRKEDLFYLNDFETKKTEIGMDTASIALGINENANMINDSQSNYKLQSYCSLRTGEDGTFGEVTEYNKNGKLKCLCIKGTFDSDILTQNEVLDYIIKQFDIVDLEIDSVDLNEKNRIYKNGSSVELKKFSINNNAGGTTIIRNSNYESELDGIKLTIVDTDGKEKNTIIKSTDTLVNSPIIVNVKSNLYDYETGFHYKGEIINDDLIKELKDLKIINTEKPIISFSEFDVEKVIDNDLDKESMEL